ncbi:MAG TPA: hypothetical protein VLW50_20170 [Streptosporangiaceae bacterium]|nr:hypothetical protein [Streptosporangiaceae bacterium]
MSAAARALAGVLALGLAVAGCGSGSHPQPRQRAAAGPHQHAATGPAAAPDSPSQSPRGPQATVLRLADLPQGFIVRPLDSRNLPSQLTGCHGLQALLAGGTGPHAQVEFFRVPLGPWIDEAVLSPAGGAARDRIAKLADALASCRSVTVTEEGDRVRLVLAPAAAPAAGAQAHAYRATGTMAGIPLSMDIVLARAGRLVLLVSNTSVTGPADSAVTAQAVRAAVRRATQT